MTKQWRREQAADDLEARAERVELVIGQSRSQEQAEELSSYARRLRDQATLMRRPALLDTYLPEEPVPAWIAAAMEQEPA